MSSPRMIWAVILAVTFLVSTAGCGGRVSEEAGDAVKAVGRLDSAVSVGINYMDYTSEVRDAKAALDAFRPSGPREERIREELSAALDFYLMAHEAWRAYDGGDWSDWIIADYWYDAYPHLEFELNLTPNVDDVRQEAWRRAAEHVAAAREELQ